MFAGRRGANCFNYKEHQLLIDKINVFGLHATIEKGVGKKKNHLRLYLPSQACKLIKQIGTCPFESMSHKWNVRPHGRIMKPVAVSPDDLKRMYIDENRTAKEIAGILGCSCATVYEKARNMGIRKCPAKCPQNTVVTPEIFDEAVRLSQHNTITDISSRIGICRKSVRHILEDAGIKYPRRSNFWLNQGEK